MASDEDKIVLVDAETSEAPAAPFYQQQRWLWPCLSRRDYTYQMRQLDRTSELFPQHRNREFPHVFQMESTGVPYTLHNRRPLGRAARRP